MLTDEQIARIERWVGPIPDAETAGYESWVSMFGGPELAALQGLTRRRSQLVLAPTNVGSGTDRVDHSRNLAAIDELIAQLVSAINGMLDELNLTEAGADLLASAGAGESAETLIVDTVATAHRRG